MKREIYRSLVEWKNSDDRKPLMLYGARQVGKTYILKEFGRNEFNNMVYINCYKNHEIEEIFSKDVNIKRILRELSAVTDSEIEPSTTFIFFDEVQEIPDVVAALKYFREDAPEYFVAAAGSLLGVLNMERISFPTGNVDIMHLYPMTFSEFMMALGHEKKVEYINDLKDKKEINSLLTGFTELLRQYYYVGGMPAAVKAYAENKPLDQIRKIQIDILEAYYSDIAKHAGRDALKARVVLQSIPAQLARENKKFIYGAVKSGARASQYENAIQWLIDAGMIYKVCRATKAALPLSFYLDKDVFKLFVLDVGLLGAMVNAPASQVLINDNIFSEYKGAFSENYVLTQLVTIPRLVISYFSKEDSTVEVDFLVQDMDKLIPIEVKAEENVKSKSLRQFVTKDNQDSGMKGVRLSMKGYIDQDWMENIPLFAVLPLAIDA